MIAALLLVLAGPQTIEITCVELIELNHVINVCGRESFSQYVFWGEYKSRGIHVKAYMMAGSNVQVVQHGDLTSALWFDGKCNRRVISRNYRETWSSMDPERLDREQLHENERQGL